MGVEFGHAKLSMPESRLDEAQVARSRSLRE
jgi:hypothetical protein